MHPSGAPQIGPAGPYHHVMPPHHMPYHGEQIPTTSHPSWHQTPLPTPPSPYQHPQQAPPQTVSYPMMPHPQQHPQQHHHPPEMPQHLAAAQQQQYQAQQIQQHQRPPNYSTPSPSCAPSAPPQNQKFRTEQWINNQAWPYAQSPAPPVVPSVMSYHPSDDRMSMLSVNTQMTNQYPESQRCYSSNGSTCENVNPEMVSVNLSQTAEQAVVMWPNTQDINQRVKMAKVIRDWIRESKFAQVDRASLPKLIPRLLDIIHDGLKTQNPQCPQQYFGSLFYYLLDSLRYMTFLFTGSDYFHLIIQWFTQGEPGTGAFREVVCRFLSPQNLSGPLRPCTNMVFQIINRIITDTKQEKLRADFARCLKIQSIVTWLLEYFDERLPLNVVEPHMFTILRFILSKDNNLKDYLVWMTEQQREVLPENSLIVRLNCMLMRAYNIHKQGGNQTPEQAQVIVTVISKTFQLLSIFLHDPVTIGAFIRAGGMGITCTALQIPNLLVARAGLNILLKISDSPALGTIPLDDRMLQFLIEFIEAHRQDDELLYFGTGFLSNFVAHKQHVKEIAIQNNAIARLHLIMTEQPRLTEVKDAPRRKRKCDIMCNCLRTMNNFLPLWAPSSNEQREAGEIERRQVCRFIEPDMVKKLMSCLSADGIETQGLMELRSTIIRYFYLLCRTPFVPKDNLLNITDERRNENLVRHIVAAFMWARQQRDEPGKQQLLERTINVLKMLMEQCRAEQVAEESYSIECPLNLINDDTKPQFLLTVLTVCDKILEHCPDRADIWTIDRVMLLKWTNHQNPDIAAIANRILTRLPYTDILACFGPSK